MQQMEKKKYLKLLFPIILLTAMLSCLIPNCIAVWDGLLVEAGLAPFPGTLGEDRLYIHVIDVGKADAIFLQDRTRSQKVSGTSWNYCIECRVDIAR